MRIYPGGTDPSIIFVFAIISTYGVAAGDMPT
jgi:hypothetical protein